MEGVFSCLLLLLALFMHASAHGDKESLDELTRQLDALTSRVVSLTKQLDARMKAKTQNEYDGRRLLRNLDDDTAKRGGCKRGFFPCSDGVEGAVQCVRDYLVCDGSPDCKTEADEAPGVCNRMPFAEPQVMKGYVIKDECGRFGDGHALAGLRPAIWTVDVDNELPCFPSKPVLYWDWAFPKLTSTGTVKTDAFFKIKNSYDYVTGDPLLETSSMVGPCVYEAYSPEKATFTCTMDKPSTHVVSWGLTESCYIARYVLNAPVLPNGP